MATALKKPAAFVLPTVKRELYYGGAWHKAHSGATQETFNPATGESLGSVSLAEAEDVDAAVKAAYEGFKVWRRMKPLERATVLRKAADVIRRHADELAMLDAADCGGPFKRMIKDSEGGAQAFEQTPFSQSWLQQSAPLAHELPSGAHFWPQVPASQIELQQSAGCTQKAPSGAHWPLPHAPFVQSPVQHSPGPMHGAPSGAHTLTHVPFWQAPLQHCAASKQEAPSGTH